MQYLNDDALTIYQTDFAVALIRIPFNHFIYSLRINCVQQRRKPVRCWCQRQERNLYLFLRPLGRLIP